MWMPLSLALLYGEHANWLPGKGSSISIWEAGSFVLTPTDAHVSNLPTASQSGGSKFSAAIFSDRANC
jgi:hypothetical protein